MHKSIHIYKILIGGALGALLFANASLAQDTRSFTPATDPAPEYAAPYSVLDVKPGMTADEAKALLDEHFGKETAIEGGTLQISSSDGQQAQFDLKTAITTPWVTGMTRMGSEPYEQVYVTLGTGVIEDRVIGISRSIRFAPEEKPAANALRAQIEEAYGPASIVDVDEYTFHMMYAWDENGFTPDLVALSETLPADELGNTIHWNKIRGLNPETPCVKEPKVGYEFESPRGELRDPNCALSFIVEIQNGGNVVFRLQDYTVDRFNTIETDKQIDKALNIEAAPSELKL